MDIFITMLSIAWTLCNTLTYACGR